MRSFCRSPRHCRFRAALSPRRCRSFCRASIPPVRAAAARFAPKSPLESRAANTRQDFWLVRWGSVSRLAYRARGGGAAQLSAAASISLGVTLLRAPCSPRSGLNSAIIGRSAARAMTRPCAHSSGCGTPPRFGRRAAPAGSCARPLVRHGGVSAMWRKRWISKATKC